MKILLLCDMFPPAFGPRMGYLCKYLKRMGWEPIVITEYISDNTFEFLANDINVTYIKYFQATGRISKQIEWIIIFLLDFFFHYKDRKMESLATTIIQKENCKLVLCSTYRTFPLVAAYKIAKQANVPLVTDLRDIIEQYAANEFIAHSFNLLPGLNKLITNIFRNKLLRDRNKVLRKSNYITTISPWHVQTLKKYNSNVELIYNGFDPELFYPEQIKTDTFRITYTGRLLSLKIRDPQLLFEAISTLSDKKLIEPEEFRIQWYTDTDSRIIIENESIKHGILSYMDFHAYVPASQIPRILNESSILLLLSNTSDNSGPQGFMTTKFFESLAVEKPILCVRSDNGCLEQAITKTKAGLSSYDIHETTDFIYKKYKEWRKYKCTSQCSHKTEIMKFSRISETEQFINIFKKIVK